VGGKVVCWRTWLRRNWVFDTSKVGEGVVAELIVFWSRYYTRFQKNRFHSDIFNCSRSCDGKEVSIAHQRKSTAKLVWSPFEY
jgi:hypothetical protein